MNISKDEFYNLCKRLKIKKEKQKEAQVNGHIAEAAERFKRRPCTKKLKWMEE